jgi:hypothetical protein
MVRESSFRSPLAPGPSRPGGPQPLEPEFPVPLPSGPGGPGELAPDFPMGAGLTF